MSGRDFYKDGKAHPLIIGDSFLHDDPEGEYVTIKYDFVPPQGENIEKTIDVDDSKNVTVTIKSENSEETVYKGSEHEAMRDCLLIIDHDTNTITLEKVGKKIQVKRTRKPGSNRTVNQMQDSSSSRMNKMSTPPVAGSMPALDFDDDDQDDPQPMEDDDEEEQRPEPIVEPQQHHALNTNGATEKSQFDSSSSSSSSSSDSSDSDSDQENEPEVKSQPPSNPVTLASAMLIDDLELSEDEE